MSTPDTGLVAILLITHSRPGPKLVFHAPLCPLACRASVSGPSVDTNGNDRPGQAAVEHAPEDQEFTKAKRQSEDDPNRKLPKANLDSEDGHILGISAETLEKVLSPGQWFDRKRFEVSIGDVTFVNHPVYADRDGEWKRKGGEHYHNVSHEEQPLTPTGEITSKSDGDRTVQSGITIIEPTPTKTKHDFAHVPGSFQSQGALSLATSMNSESTASANATPEPLTAFQVVFALSKSGGMGTHPAVSVVYEQLAKKLSKALAFLQKDSSYVGMESRKLSQLRTQAKQNGWKSIDLQTQMIQRSELAWALDQIWSQLSKGETADFRLAGVAISLQPQEPPRNLEAIQEISRHSTILLTEDKDTLLRALAHSDAAPLAHFISAATPTKGLQKQTASLGIPINNLLYLARHLIIWRKARVIAPLHPRNTYVLAREAPLDRLESHAREYATLFPALPSLAQVLKVLSGKPLRWGVLIPSRDHRGPYMEILAFLVRYHFVEQLKTFGWMRAPATPTVPSPTSDIAGKDTEVEANKNRRPISVASLLSPQLRPQADDDVASVSSERTAIAISHPHKAMRPEPPHDPISIAREPLSDAIQSKLISPEIIRGPLNPSPEDELRLQHILEEIEDEELRLRLPTLCQYFNGEEVLEEVAAREGMKRSVFDAWLDWLIGKGFVVTFRRV